MHRNDAGDLFESAQTVLRRPLLRRHRKGPLETSAGGRLEAEGIGLGTFLRRIAESPTFE